MGSPYTSRLLTARKVIPLTASADPLANGVCQGLWIGGEGTIDIVDNTGTAVSAVYVIPGLAPFQCQKVTAIGVGVTVWALYTIV